MGVKPSFQAGSPRNGAFYKRPGLFVQGAGLVNRFSHLVVSLGDSGILFGKIDEPFWNLIFHIAVAGFSIIK